MAIEVIMPSLGFDMVEGTVSRWLKEEGDPVKKGEAIVEIETEKANVEVEATASGVLEKIAVPAGETVAVGTVIGLIAALEEKPSGETKEKPAEKPEMREPSGPPSDSPAAVPEKVREVPKKPAEKRKEEPDKDRRPGRRVKASPVARKIAEEAGIDLERVRGSGPGGRIMERDIQARMGEKPSPEEPKKKAGTPAGEPVPMSRMRKAIARRMTESKAKAPHFYVTVDVNMDNAMSLRDQLNHLAPETEKISVNDVILAATAKTLSRFPDMNATYHEEGLEKHSRIDIGIAVALPDGLISPVLRDADKKALREIAAGSKELGERARTGKLRSEDLGSGTFTISNLGMFDVEEFTAIINPPEAAILAVGAVTPRPIAAGGQVRIASMMKATLSVDHRVADGAQAGRFLQELKKLLENPVNLLAV
jgi:pyruvate dehydrogenase E2 component (dihydrolipoyllysine-residue acetyltransferase)